MGDCRLGAVADCAMVLQVRWWYDGDMDKGKFLCRTLSNGLLTRGTRPSVLTFSVVANSPLSDLIVGRALSIEIREQ